MAPFYSRCSFSAHLWREMPAIARMNEKKKDHSRKTKEGALQGPMKAAIGKARRNVAWKQNEKLILASSFAAKLKTETEGSRSLRS